MGKQRLLPVPTAVKPVNETEIATGCLCPFFISLPAATVYQVVIYDQNKRNIQLPIGILCCNTIVVIINNYTIIIEISRITYCYIIKNSY